VVAFQPSSAPQVAAALKVHPRTARRLLNRLVEDGWLRRSDGRKPLYAPTMRIVALAAQLTARAPVVRFGAEVAADLHARSGLAVHLAVPSYRCALRLLRVGEPHGLSTGRDLAPVHAVAAGKVLLAHRHPWREHLLTRELERVTEATIVDADVIQVQAALTRERGFAVEEAEYRTEGRAVGAPVTDLYGEVVAALAVSGPPDELADIDAVAADVMAASSELSHRVVTGSPT